MLKLNKDLDCGKYPKPSLALRWIGICSIDLPFKQIFPLSGDCSPMQIESKVVFPQPSGPNIPTHSPG